MQTKEAIEFFGSAKALAETLRITKGAVSQWGELVPEKNALYLERVTRGELSYNAEIYRRKLTA